MQLAFQFENFIERLNLLPEMTDIEDFTLCKSEDTTSLSFSLDVENCFLVALVTYYSNGDGMTNNGNLENLMDLILNHLTTEWKDKLHLFSAPVALLHCRYTIFVGQNLLQVIPSH